MKHAWTLTLVFSLTAFVFGQDKRPLSRQLIARLAYEAAGLYRRMRKPQANRSPAGQ